MTALWSDFVLSKRCHIDGYLKRDSLERKPKSGDIMKLSYTRAHLKFHNLVHEILNVISGPNGYVEVTQLDILVDELKGEDASVGEFRIDCRAGFSLRGTLFSICICFQYTESLGGRMWIDEGSPMTTSIGRSFGTPVLVSSGTSSSERICPDLEKIQRYLAAVIKQELDMGRVLEPKRMLQTVE